MTRTDHVYRATLIAMVALSVWLVVRDSPRSRTVTSTLAPIIVAPSPICDCHCDCAWPPEREACP